MAAPGRVGHAEKQGEHKQSSIGVVGDSFHMPHGSKLEPQARCIALCLDVR